VKKERRVLESEMKQKTKRKQTMERIKTQIGYFLHILLCITFSRHFFVNGKKQRKKAFASPYQGMKYLVLLFFCVRFPILAAFVINFRPFTFILSSPFCVMSIIDFYAFFSSLSSEFFCGKIMKGNRKNEWIDLCVGNRFGMQKTEEEGMAIH
jgi:hypothetical protein